MDPNEPVQNNNDVTLSDLEKALETETSSDELAVPDKNKSNGDTPNKVSELDALLMKISKRISVLKTAVQSGIESLKKLKEDLGGKIGEMKELEETALKIKDEVQKINQVESEILSLKKEASDELGL